MYINNYIEELAAASGALASASGGFLTSIWED